MPTNKPTVSRDLVGDARPKLEKYIGRVLPGRSLNQRVFGKDLTLVAAKPFSEGHINETWHLRVQAGPAQASDGLG